jgi:nucleolar protein 56
MTKSLVPTWTGAYLVEDGQIVREIRAPIDVESLSDRARRRRGGGRTPEEEALLADRHGELWVTRDRRLAGPGVRFDPAAAGSVAADVDAKVRREVMLHVAEDALESAWDPSVHVEEATRSVRDLDRATNLLGERLASWASRDAPGLDPGDASGAAKLILDGIPTSRFGPSDPSLGAARRKLAEAYRALQEARDRLEESVAAAVPARMPNLDRLLGPDLAASLIAQAGGLDRLARLPSSTVQVLGAEKAFFEHLRGRAPPPRHGLLFLHPSIQSAPRASRGKLARALAGKTSIAARLDRAGSPLDPSLRATFDRREAEIKAQRLGSGRARRARPGSRPPLDTAAEHR